MHQSHEHEHTHIYDNYDMRKGNPKRPPRRQQTVHESTRSKANGWRRPTYHLIDTLARMAMAAICQYATYYLPTHLHTYEVVPWYASLITA